MVEGHCTRCQSIAKMTNDRSNFESACAVDHLLLFGNSLRTAQSITILETSRPGQSTRRHLRTIHILRNESLEKSNTHTTAE